MLDVIIASSDAGVHVNGAKDGALKLSEGISTKEIIKQIEFNKSNDIKDLKKNLKEVNDFNSKLYNSVLSSLKENNKVLTIGGDHVIAIASALASASYNKSIGVIWIDAHGDYNTFDTTISGNLHGLPLAVIDNYEKNLLNEFHNGGYALPKNTVIIGGRDFDKEEYENLKDAGVTIFSTNDIKNGNINDIVDEAIKIASNGTNKIHISFDIDVIDPKLAPGVSIPAVNGIDYEEANKILDRVLEHKDVINTFDLVEYNPLTDTNDTYSEIVKLRDKIINNLN